MTPILSILTPTIPERIDKFSSLFEMVVGQVKSLHKNHPSLGSVELISNPSSKFLDGGLSIGKKREGLVNVSNGKYVCFLDDDEDIAPNYVETLVRLCQHNADVITFRNLTCTDTYWTIVDMSLQYQVNDQASPNFITRRRPWHICPVKSEFAKLYPFEDINYGEDYDWMSKLLTHCTTESHTDAVLHMYKHSSKTSESDKIINAGHK
jgi:hypothetical protein